ncbi:hypothetical protein [Ornithinimicrobium sp. INDO-MA30-4]|uniref:hypothetical protein n=1 Tax=Ornithinimicrobium sp. INDO-MA30-4 TaxID=2908651 RepID=UPI001F4601DE|nr:hypothetical protein [Ornithinimicrobium sp. INDO-MA30-4]UJH69802.1 hypothetical protein L0A91_11075 [Ornithinimicrobium sp. INDO-MA30-4]
MYRSASRSPSPWAPWAASGAVLFFNSVEQTNEHTLFTPSGEVAGFLTAFAALVAIIFAAGRDASGQLAMWLAMARTPGDCTPVVRWLSRLGQPSSPQSRQGWWH